MSLCGYRVDHLTGLVEGVTCAKCLEKLPVWEAAVERYAKKYKHHQTLAEKARVAERKRSVAEALDAARELAAKPAPWGRKRVNVGSWR